LAAIWAAVDIVYEILGNEKCRAAGRLSAFSTIAWASKRFDVSL
jgi:hypothetical protein